MKFILVILAVFVVESLMSQNAVTEYYDPWTKSKIMAEYQVNAAGEKHGWFKGYDQQGVLVNEFNFKNNLRHGVNKEYGTAYGSREILQTETYVKGVLNGPAKYYGKLDGKSIVIREGEFLNGEKEGEWLDLIAYVNYEIPEEERKDSRYVKRILYFSEGLLNQDDGVTSFIPDGEYKTFYYPSGKIRSIENYKSGLKKSDFTSFYADGKIEREAIYGENGNILFVKEYHPNEQLRYHEDLREDDYIYFEFDKNGNETRKSLTIKNNRQKKINQNKEREKLAPILLKQADSLANEKKYFEALSLLDKSYNFIKVNALHEVGVTDNLIISSGYHDKYMVYFNKTDSINKDNDQKVLEVNYLTEVLSLISKNEDFSSLSFDQYKKEFVDFWSNHLFFGNRQGVNCNEENFYTETNSQYGGSCFKRALRSSFYYNDDSYNKHRRIENYINQIYPILRNRSNIYFYNELSEIYKICSRAWGFYRNNISADEFFVTLRQLHNELNTLVDNVINIEKLTSEITLMLNEAEEKLLTKPANKKALNQALILSKTAFQEKDKQTVNDALVNLLNIKSVLAILMNENNPVDKSQIKSISNAESLEQIKSILEI
jgi:antitoxin component YwqK of YwqJK toxin-antitoxin module